MKVSVDLQEPFTYAVWPILLVGFLILICVGILVWPKIKRFKKKKVKPQVIQITPPKNIALVKEKYLIDLKQIENALSQNRISTREAYKQMSKCIRSFVNEATGIEVLNYTLQDIQRLHMPMLEALIAEYYAPEFAEKSIGDSMAALEKTKRVIEIWK